MGFPKELNCQRKQVVSLCSSSRHTVKLQRDEDLWGARKVSLCLQILERKRMFFRPITKEQRGRDFTKVLWGTLVVPAKLRLQISPAVICIKQIFVALFWKPTPLSMFWGIFFPIAFAPTIWGERPRLPKQQMSCLTRCHIWQLKDPARLPRNTPTRSAGVSKGRGFLPAWRLRGKGRSEAEQQRRHIDRLMRGQTALMDDALALSPLKHEGAIVKGTVCGTLTSRYDETQRTKCWRRG